MRQIQLEISKCDIVEEVFSKFTSRFVVLPYDGAVSHPFADTQS